MGGSLAEIPGRWAMSKNDMQELAATVEEIRTRTNAVTSEAITARKRLETLPTLIAESIASADAGLTRELRSERQDLESVVRDAEGSERVLSRKLETAVQQLAVVQLPEMQRAAEIARNELEKSVQRTRVNVQVYLDRSRDFIQTRNHARRNNEDDRLNVSVEPLSNITAAVAGSLRDLFGLQ